MSKLPWTFWVPWSIGGASSQFLFAKALYRCGADPVVLTCEVLTVLSWSGMLWRSLSRECPPIRTTNAG